MGLALNACHGNGADDITLEYSIQNQHRYGKHQSACHQFAIVKVVLTLKGSQAHRQSQILTVTAQDQEGP